MRYIIPIGLLFSVVTFGQEVRVESPKNVDFSIYKSFRFGDSEIVTTRGSKKISDASLDKIIRETIERELKEKGLSRDEENGQLMVTYMSGTFRHSELQRLGPLGVVPGQFSQNQTVSYNAGSLVIDLNDVRNNHLIWRVNSNVDVNQPNPRNALEQVVVKGFKKFGVNRKNKKP